MREPELWSGRFLKSTSLATTGLRRSLASNQTVKRSVNSSSKRKAIGAVAKEIINAFADVKLEDGVGLTEGLEIDACASAEDRSAARANDETQDWSLIPPELLNGAATSLSFFDAKGMRFHLPAYLIADLQGTLNQDIRFHLNTRGLDERFSLLSQKQKDAVRHYLELQLELLPEPNVQFEQSAIRDSINGFWSAQP